MNPRNHTPIHHIVQKHAATVTPSKESEPILVKQESPLQSKEIYKVVEGRKVDGEIENHIEVVKENVELDTEVQQAGVEAVEATRFPDYQVIKVPLSDNKIAQGLHAPITSSFRWLAELCKYLLMQAHLTLKEIRGQTIRVKSNS